jgi:hypothetical protein
MVTGWLTSESEGCREFISKDMVAESLPKYSTASTGITKDKTNKALNAQVNKKNKFTNYITDLY